MADVIAYAHDEVPVKVKTPKATKVKTLAEEVEEFAVKVRGYAEDAEPGASKARYEQAAAAIESAHEALVARSAEVAEAKRQAESIAADAAAAEAGTVGEN